MEGSHSTKNDESIEYETKNKWNFLYHLDENKLWRPVDFIKLCSVSNLRELWLLLKSLSCEHINGFKDSCIYYLMRDDITPAWEDSKNRGGTTLSIQVPETIMIQVWSLLVMLVVGETFAENNGLVNGICIKYVPKNNTNTTHYTEPFALIKILISVRQLKSKEIIQGTKTFLKNIIPEYIEEKYRKKYCKKDFSIQITENNPEY